jgi:APA family basic amino acid/polyamine antiporter
MGLRWRQPEAARPFRAWGYPLTPLLAGVVSLAFLGGELLTHPLDGLLAIALVGSGIPLLWLQPRPTPIES